MQGIVDFLNEQTLQHKANYIAIIPHSRLVTVSVEKRLCIRELNTPYGVMTIKAVIVDGVYQKIDFLWQMK